jgi:hypothetical protein
VWLSIIIEESLVYTRARVSSLNLQIMEFDTWS